MRRKLFSIFIVTLLIVMGIDSYGQYALAATNREYHEAKTLSDEEKESNQKELNDNIENSTLLQIMASFILAVGDIIENLVTSFASFIFGVDEYPWADMIVFNSVPYLDVNFINPDDNSIFGITFLHSTQTDKNGKPIIGDMMIGDVIKDLYYSLLIMSVSLLGIGVSITAIRLAASTIASDKAKYKEAITKCVYTILILTSIHFLISFMFYLNESICSTASTYLKSVITERLKQEMELKRAEYHSENNARKVQYFVLYNALGFPDIKKVDSEASFWEKCGQHMENAGLFVKEFVQGVPALTNVLGDSLSLNPLLGAPRLLGDIEGILEGDYVGDEETYIGYYFQIMDEYERVFYPSEKKDWTTEEAFAVAAYLLDQNRSDGNAYYSSGSEGRFHMDKYNVNTWGGPVPDAISNSFGNWPIVEKGDLGFINDANEGSHWKSIPNSQYVAWCFIYDVKQILKNKNNEEFSAEKIREDINEIAKDDLFEFETDLDTDRDTDTGNILENAGNAIANFASEKINDVTETVNDFTKFEWLVGTDTVGYYTGTRQWMNDVVNCKDFFFTDYTEDSEELKALYSNMIKEIAYIFKYSTVRTNRDADKADPIGAVIYAILLIQSLMLLITYMRRVFFVTALSLLGPIVVVYDFILSTL